MLMRACLSDTPVERGDGAKPMPNGQHTVTAIKCDLMVTQEEMAPACEHMLRATSSEHGDGAKLADADDRRRLHTSAALQRETRLTPAAYKHGAQ